VRVSCALVRVRFSGRPWTSADVGGITGAKENPARTGFPSLRPAGFEPATRGLEEGYRGLGRFRHVWRFPRNHGESGLLTRFLVRLVSVGLVATLLPPAAARLRDDRPPRAGARSSAGRSARRLDKKKEGDASAAGSASPF